MHLRRYLDERDESATSFAKRADLAQQTVQDVLRGGTGRHGCTLVTAWRIVKASRAHPTRHGGTVDFEDLLPPGAFEPPERQRSAVA